MAQTQLTNTAPGRIKDQPVLVRVSDAARLLSLSRPTLMQWIRSGRLHSERTPGGHYRIPRSEVERLGGVQTGGRRAETDDGDLLSAISGRNKLLGTVTRVRFGGLLAEVGIAIGDQELTAIITSASCRTLGLKPGVRAFGLVKATEVMVIRAAAAPSAAAPSAAAPRSGAAKGRRNPGQTGRK
jgi:molybdopterin-binding protein